MQTITTSDLYFAAFLQCMGCKITKTDKENPSKCSFVFEDPLNRNSLKDDYFNESQESSIPALKYSNSIRSLKTLVYCR